MKYDIYDIETKGAPVIGHLKKHGRGYLYFLGLYLLIILATWRNNPDKTASETLVFAIKLPFLISYIIFVDVIPHAITRAAKGAAILTYGFLWFAYIASGILVVVWIVLRFIRSLRP